MEKKNLLTDEDLRKMNDKLTEINTNISFLEECVSDIHFLSDNLDKLL